MLPACNRGMGGDVHFPDVCKTPMPPPVGMLPLPYPNLAFNMMAVTFSMNVFWTFMPALTMASRIAMSIGDELGSLGGLISGIIKGPAGVWVGNPIVSVNGMPAKNLLCPTHSNNYNATLGMSAIPSLTNVLLTDREVAADNADAEAPDKESINRGQRQGLTAHSLRKLRKRLTASEPLHGVLLGSGIALVRLGVMTSDVSRALFNLLREPGWEALSALVFDLRGNPGGDAQAGLELCDDFLPQGALLAWREEHDDKLAVYARQEHPYAHRLAIVVDGQSASAAELFAGVLQSHGRARLFGEKTWGKGSVARLAAAATGGAHVAAVGQYLLPDGRAIDGVGLTPDQLIAPTAADPDAALSCAIHWARGATTDD